MVGGDAGRSAQEMRSADAVVIGGGVHGASTAFHLAKKGLQVVLVERRHAASGATGKSSALVRMHYTVLEEAELAWESWKYFTNWQELVGGDCDFVQTGFARLVHRSQQDKLKRNVELMAERGIDTHLVTAEELREIDPGVVVDDVDYAAYEPRSGYADPYSTCLSFLSAARALGVVCLEETRVEAVMVAGGQASGVRTDRGDVSAPIIVIAAGNGSKRLCAGLGFDLPVWPFYIKTAIFERPEPLRRRHLTYIDGPNATYFRPEGSNLTLVGGTSWEVRVDDPETDETTIDFDFIAETGALMSRRFPAMHAAASRGGDIGYDTMSGDGHPIIGKLPGWDGVFVQTGMSGTGFKISPSVGRNLAEYVVTGRWAEVQCDIFSPERFTRGVTIRGPYDYKEGTEQGAESAYGV